MKLLPGSLAAFALILGALHALPTMAEDRNQDSKSMTTIVLNNTAFICELFKLVKDILQQELAFSISTIL